MKKNVSLFALLVVLLGMIGCTSTGPKVEHIDPTTANTISANFSSTDLQLVAEKMVDSLLTFPPIVQMTQDRRPVLYVDKIRKGIGVDEHIDYDSIYDSISTRLLRSGKFRFADMKQVNEVLNQQEFQHSGVVDPSTAVQMGKIIGAEFVMYGNISKITSRDGNMRDIYYKITLKLMNVETAIVEWMEEKEIRKQAKRQLIGS